MTASCGLCFQKNKHLPFGLKGLLKYTSYTTTIRKEHAKALKTFARITAASVLSLASLWTSFHNIVIVMEFATNSM